MHTLLAAESSSPLKFDWGEIILGLIAFAVLFFIFAKYVAPRMEKTFAERHDAIEGGIARAEAAQAEAEATKKRYEDQLSGAESEAAAIRDQARAQGHQILESMKSDARAEADRIVATGDEQLAASRQAVVAELRGEVGTLALSLAEKVVGESLADDTRARAVIDRFIADLEAGADSVESATGESSH